MFFKSACIFTRSWIFAFGAFTDLHKCLLTSFLWLTVNYNELEFGINIMLFIVCSVFKFKDFKLLSIINCINNDKNVIVTFNYVQMFYASE